MVKNFYQWLDQKLNPIHPFLLGVFPWIYVFSKYLKDFSYGVLWLPLLAVSGIAAGFVFLFRVLFKNKSKASVLVSIGAVGLLYYGFFYDFLFGFKVSGFLVGRHRYLYPFWGILFSGFGLFLLFAKRNLDKLAKILKFAALGLIIMPLASIAVFEFKNIGGSSIKTEISSDNKGPQNMDKSDEVKETPNISQASDFPDIYYILPDQYVRLDVLKQYFNYDSKEFAEFLGKKGFVIAEKSRSNYAITIFSLAATLNMNYIGDLIDLPDENSADFDPLIEKIRNNEVKKFVESKGYRYIYLSSDALVVGAKDTGDDVIESNLDTYMRQALKTTVLRPFAGRYNFREKNINKWARNSVLNTFDQLSKIPTSNLKGPKFVFAHIMAPHGPYVFGRNGEEVELSLVKSPTYREDMEAFLDQSIFISKKISEVVDRIISKSERPPIIVIQSDHGHYLDPKLAGDDLRKSIRTKNFSAFYLPGRDKKALPQDITAVNTFRFIFDRYFGTKYGLLENRSYTYNGQYPFRFVKIVPDD